MAAPSAKTACALYKRSLKRREQFEPLWEEIIDFCFPQKINFNQSNMVRGQRRTDFIYDDTAPDGVPRASSNFLMGMFPPQGKAFVLEPPIDVTGEQKKRLQEDLNKAAELTHDAMRQSNFMQEADEAFKELMIGTCTMSCDPGRYKGELIYRAYACTDISMLFGADNYPYAWFVATMMSATQLVDKYPNGKLHADRTRQFQSDNSPGAEATEVEFKVVEACIRQIKQNDDGIPRYDYIVLDEEKEHIIYHKEFKGDSQCKYWSTRWSTASNEGYGRGPLTFCLPSIKTVNLVKQLHLENAEWAITGLYTYPDDGVFNPDNIILEPGTFLPTAPNSEIRALPNASQFDLSQIVIEDERMAIRRALFIDDWQRRDAKTPPSARQVVEEKADRAAQMGSTIGRLKNEFLVGCIRRTMAVLAGQGVFEANDIDLKRIRINPVSPLMRMQDYQDIADFLRWFDQMSYINGQGVAAQVNLDEGSAYITEKNNIDANRFLNNQDQKKQAIEGMMQLQGAMGEQGVKLG